MSNVNGAISQTLTFYKYICIVTCKITIGFYIRHCWRIGAKNRDTALVVMNKQ